MDREYLDPLDGGRHEVVFESFQSSREISACHGLLAVISPPLRTSRLRVSPHLYFDAAHNVRCLARVDAVNILRLRRRDEICCEYRARLDGGRHEVVFELFQASCEISADHMCAFGGCCSGPIFRLLKLLFEHVNPSQNVFEFNSPGSSLQDRFCGSYLSRCWRSRVDHNLH